jgi:AcrR family transcriptional regulator
VSPAGRRPGPQKTRAAIVKAARGEFATAGYAETTIRSVARAVDVDPTLDRYATDPEFCDESPLVPRALRR